MTYEQAHELAIHATLRPVAAIMGEIGWHTTLASLTEEQIKRLIETAVLQYQAERYGLKYPGAIPF